MSTFGANVVKTRVRTSSAIATRSDEFFSMFHDAIAVADGVIVESVDREVHGVRLPHKRHLWLVAAISTRGGSREDRHFVLKIYCRSVIIYGTSILVERQRPELYLYRYGDSEEVKPATHMAGNARGS
jgi:hypothetical protein